MKSRSTEHSAMDDIEVYNNIIYKTALAGIWIFGSGSYSTSSANVHIHHNQIYDTGTNSNNKVIGGILSDGFNALIENNVIDGAYGAGIVQNNVYSPAPAGSGYVITVRNNIITNTRTSAAGGNGYGICNLLTDTHSFVLQNNCFYNNTGGDYIGVQASPSDIAADPQYADRDKHDYHLKSKAGRWDGSGWVNDNISSPCIDAGDPLSDYSNEPEPNGNRINIGPDGNTRYASKSELYVPTPILPTANFSSNITGSYPPLSIQFMDCFSEYNCVELGFGDSTYSTQQNPTHTYSAAGNYNVNLTASNGNGTDSKLSTINVLKSTPTITWNNPAGIIYGTALSSTQLTASASVPGTFVYTPTAGTVLNTGTRHYMSISHLLIMQVTLHASKDVTINVLKSTPTITWSNPAGIIYGTALSSTQLTASASVPGTFVYTPTAGTVLNTGTKTLHVDFTPTDYANYTTASKDVTINVLKSTPTITWSNPAGIIYGTALSSTQLNASASVPGTFVYTPTAGTVLNTGTKTLHVDFTPTDNASYTTASKDVTINVLKSTPTITWSNPAGIIYGTALSSTQLNASASVPGTFVYTPTAGTVLNAGTQTLHVDFTPTDYANYTTASKDVTINVLKSTPTITWSNPAGITYGTALSSTQLTASASVPGTFVYTPTAGTVLNTGTKTLHVDFTPTDYASYTTASKDVTINVSEKPVPPVASFSSNITSGNAPLNVLFTDTSTGTPTSWNWNFGDGTTNSIQKNPAHTYSKGWKLYGYAYSE